MHRPVQPTRSIPPSAAQRLSPAHPPPQIAMPPDASPGPAGPCALGLGDLPLELLLEIAGKLLPADYANFRLTCRRHHQALSHPTALQDLTRRTLEQARGHLDGFRRVDGPGDPVDRVTAAFRFLEESWGFMCADVQLRELASRLLRRATTSAHRMAGLDLQARNQGDDQALILIHALQGMARRLRPSGDFGRYDRLQSCSRELARQTVRCADPARRAGLVETLTELLQITAGTRCAYGHLFMLAQLVEQVPEPQRRAPAVRIGALAAPLQQAEASRIGHLLAAALDAPPPARPGGAARR